MAKKKRRVKAARLFQGNLQRIMSEREINQPELARRLSCQQSYVSNLVGGRKIPSFTQLDKIAKAVGEDVIEFFQPLT